jgi:hypothetical protein
MTQKILLTLFFGLVTSHAACVVYGDGGISPTAILPGNDDDATVSGYYGEPLTQLYKDDSGGSDTYDDITGVVAVVKAGREFAVYSIDDGCIEFVPFSKKDISHVAFYGTRIVPEPNRVLLAIAGFFCLLLHRRRPGQVRKKKYKINPAP